MFSCNFCEMFKNIYFGEPLPTDASITSQQQLYSWQDDVIQSTYQCFKESFNCGKLSLLFVYLLACLLSKKGNGSRRKRNKAIEKIEKCCIVEPVQSGSVDTFHSKTPTTNQLVQSQRQKHQKKVCNMFKVNDKNTRTWLWCFYC